MAKVSHKPYYVSSILLPLQVLILKRVNASGEWRERFGRGRDTPFRVFAYEWQGKDLRDRECVRVANKGLTNRLFCVSVQLKAMDLPQRHGEHREDFGVEEGTRVCVATLLPWRVFGDFHDPFAFQ